MAVVWSCLARPERDELNGKTCMCCAAQHGHRARSCAITHFQDFDAVQYHQTSQLPCLGIWHMPSSPLFCLSHSTLYLPYSTFEVTASSQDNSTHIPRLMLAL